MNMTFPVISIERDLVILINIIRVKLNLLVPTQRQMLGSHRATFGALSTLNNDCEAHIRRRIQQYRPD